MNRFIYIIVINTVILLIIREKEQNTSKDTISEESESDAETCVISSRKPLSVQSENKFSKTCIKDRQKTSIKRKIVRQNRAIANSDNDSETYSPKIKKRRSSKFIFTFISYSVFTNLSNKSVFS